MTSVRHCTLPPVENSVVDGNLTGALQVRVRCISWSSMEIIAFRPAEQPTVRLTTSVPTPAQRTGPDGREHLWGIHGIFVPGIIFVVVNSSSVLLRYHIVVSIE